MPSARRNAGRLVLGGVAFGALVALLLWVDSLDRARHGARSSGPVPAPELAEPEWRMAVEPPPELATRRDPAAAEARVPAGLEDLRQRVDAATAELVEALDVPLFREKVWQEAVRTRAGSLGAEALPELEAILGDDARSVEEHIAASELVSALRAH